MNSDKCLKRNSIIWWQKILLLLFTIHYSLFTFSQVGSWQNHLAYSEVQNICEAGNDLFVLASNDLYQYNQNDQSITTYDKVNGLSDINIIHIAWNPQAKRLIIVYQNSNIDLLDVKGNVTNISALYSKTMTEDKSVSKITIDGIYAWLHCGFGYVKVNMQAVEISDTYMENHPDYPTSLPDYDEYKDLATYSSIVSSLSPGGPKYNYFYESKFLNHKLYTTGGYFLSGMPDLLHPGTIQVYHDNEWTIFEDELEKKTGYRYVDINCIDIDPTDENHVFAGGRCGLYEFQNGKLLSYYNKDNSPLRGAYTGGQELGNDYVLVHSIKFDQEGNLWVLNSQAKGVNLLRLTKDKKWEKYYKSQLENDKGIGERGLRNMFFDSRGLLCFINTYWTNPFISFYQPSSDEIVIYNSFVNQDGTKYNVTYVNCACEDKEGNIWVGTNIGLFYLAKNEVGQEGAIFNQVKVPRNDGSDYADYLLNGINISHISIDGGNRKWVSTTGSGVFLISADNLTQIHNFTKDNSKLISNNIYSSAIDHQTGRVYFLTDMGLCSYLSDATEPVSEMSKDNIYAYPNPVTPDYTGLITVVGLSYNADVKIVSSNGALIAEGRSNGGSFTWNGKDKNGDRVASGVYMVVAATSEGKKGTVCKIAVIN
jgi:streptogramin lyase